MSKRKPKWVKCHMSGQSQMLAWAPDKSGYPGAVVCLGCSFGVQIRKGSDHPAVSGTGIEWLAGTVRTHYVFGVQGARHLEKMQYRKP